MAEAALGETNERIVQEGSEGAASAFFLESSSIISQVAHDPAAHQPHDLLAQFLGILPERSSSTSNGIRTPWRFPAPGEGGWACLWMASETDQITGEVEGGDLFVTLFGDGVRLDGPGT